MDAMTNGLSKIFLVAARPPVATAPPTPVVRRFRLARVRLDPRPAGAGRHDHLRRMYD
jgi:hypothetical protein